MFNEVDIDVKRKIHSRVAVLSTVLMVLLLFTTKIIAGVSIVIWVLIMYYSLYTIIFKRGGYNICPLTVYLVEKMESLYDTDRYVQALFLALGFILLAVFAINGVVHLYCSVFLTLY